ncbi:alpha-galactosidase, partial [Coprococcus eutactus]|uniref:alpha-galactosidase n=1 Tax=Coprococcus eutactus TaxID=33043 RepID=UPI00210C0596
DIGSVEFTGDRQGELAQRYVLGVYELLVRLVNDFPDLLLENCSGGGARFDPGMLYYSPQIWCSDDTDAIERLS